MKALRVDGLSPEDPVVVMPCLTMKLQVDGLSQGDPVVVMPCLTALQTLQPVFFENLKTDNKVASIFVRIVITLSFLKRWHGKFHTSV